MISSTSYFSVFIDDFRNRTSSFLLRGRWRNIRSEEYFVKDGPDGAPGTQEIELVSRFANLLYYFEGAVALVVKLL